MPKSTEDKFERKDRHSADPKSSVNAPPKKGGAGGKFTLGKLGDEGAGGGGALPDRGDPNYDSEEEERQRLQEQQMLQEQPMRQEERRRQEQATYNPSGWQTRYPWCSTSNAQVVASTGGQGITIFAQNLEGATVASWTGDPKSTVLEVKSSVSEQVGKHVLLISLLWRTQELSDHDVIAEIPLPDEAKLQLVISTKLAEQRFGCLEEKLGELDYGSNTSEVFPLAAECLEVGARSVNEISSVVRDGCEKAGSLTGMPNDWFEMLAAHPDSRCDTPAEWHNELLHAAIFHEISLADKPFFRNGPWSDKVDYPEWGWGARIGGTPLDMALRSLEVALENPPDWGCRRELPKPDETLDLLQENFMTLLRSGFKMSRVEGGRRQLSHSSPEAYDAETVWKPALKERSDPPYGRYGAVYRAWKEAGEPLVTIPATNPDPDEP